MRTTVFPHVLSLQNSLAAKPDRRVARHCALGTELSLVAVPLVVQHCLATEPALVPSIHAPVLAVGEKLVEGHRLRAASEAVLAPNDPFEAVVLVVVRDRVGRNIHPTELAAHDPSWAALNLRRE